MVLDVSGSAPTITVEEKADETVVSGATAFLPRAGSTTAGGTGVNRNDPRIMKT